MRNIQSKLFLKKATLAIVFAGAIGIINAAQASQKGEQRFQTEVANCLLEVKNQINVVGAIRIRHNITDYKPAYLGNVVTIDPLVGDLDWLSVSGNRIVDESGIPVVLRGANVENWQWIWADSSGGGNVLRFEREAIPMLTGMPPIGWGANLIHIDVAAIPLINGSNLYLSALDEIVATAKENGAYTMMSMRYMDILDQPSSPNQTTETGAAVLAARYANEPAVIYVVGSEPHI